jgi:hypothetical protein
MKQHTNAFKEKLPTMGRQINSIITYGNTTLDEELFAVTPHFKTNLLKSVMKQLDIESSVDIPLGTVVNYQLGLMVNGEYEYLNYGNYVVYKSEMQKDKRTYLIKCRDKMIYAMKKNEQLNVVYPVTIKNYLNAIGQKIGLQVADTNFNNYSMQIPAELYLGLEYTYRDILDEIAEVAGGNIIINANDELEVVYPNTTGDTINEEYLDNTNVTIGEKYGPINSVVLSRAGESDNVYLRDEESVEENGLCEIKIKDNQIMNFNNRSDYLQGILNAVDGVEYYLNNFKSKGILYYDVLDKYDIQIGNDTYNCLMLNDEIDVTQGIEEIVCTELPEVSETDYEKADKTDMRINQTYIIVDKQNQTIESVVSNVTKQNNKISRVEQTVDELNSKISDIADVTVMKEEYSGSLSFTDINASEPVYIKIRPTGQNISYLYPFQTNLYPANNLYITLRTLRFTNTSTNEVFNFILQDDLLYYDSTHYDELTLDYGASGGTPTVYINKKCKYNVNTGAVELLSQETTTEYTGIDYPDIPLTDGDYTVQMLKYDNTVYPCYLQVRLMAKNIYTTQFAIKSEVKTEIKQTATSIDLSVNQKLSNYSTTTQMNSAINLKANQITSQVSETYATKTTTNTLSSRISQTAKSIALTVNNGSTSSGITITTTKEDGTTSTASGTITMNGLVKFTDLSTSGSTTINGSNITTGTLDASKVTVKNLDASKITTGTMTAGAINLGNGKFSVTTAGALTATSGNIAGWSISDIAISKSIGDYNITLRTDRATNQPALLVWDNNNSRYNWYVRADGYMYARNADISGTITATSGTFQNCTITNSCTVPAGTVTGQLSTGNIPNLSASKITSGTLDAKRINGIDVTFSTLGCTGDINCGAAVSAQNGYSCRGYDGVSFYSGATYVVVNDGETGWSRLVFRGGILTAVQHSW